MSDSKKQKIGLTREEEELLGIIIDSPGITTLELTEKVSYSYEILIKLLKSLLAKGMIYGTEETKWYQKIQEA